MQASFCPTSVFRWRRDAPESEELRVYIGKTLIAEQNRRKRHIYRIAMASNLPAMASNLEAMNVRSCEFTLARPCLGLGKFVVAERTTDNSTRPSGLNAFGVL